MINYTEYAGCQSRGPHLIPNQVFDGYEGRGTRPLPKFQHFLVAITTLHPVPRAPIYVIEPIPKLTRNVPKSSFMLYQSYLPFKSATPEWNILSFTPNCIYSRIYLCIYFFFTRSSCEEEIRELQRTCHLRSLISKVEQSTRRSNTLPFSGAKYWPHEWEETFWRPILSPGFYLAWVSIFSKRHRMWAKQPEEKKVRMLQSSTGRNSDFFWNSICLLGSYCIFFRTVMVRFSRLTGTEDLSEFWSDVKNKSRPSVREMFKKYRSECSNFQESSESRALSARWCDPSLTHLSFLSYFLRFWFPNSIFFLPPPLCLLNAHDIKAIFFS